MLLFPRTVYCSAQYSKAVQFHSQGTHPTRSELSSLETHEPENMIARPQLTVNSPLVPEPECLQSPHRVPENHGNDSLLAHRTFTLICKPDPALCLLHSPCPCYSLHSKRELSHSPTHYRRVPSLLKTGTVFCILDRSLLESRAETFLFSAAYIPALYNLPPCLFSLAEHPSADLWPTPSFCGYHTLIYNSAASNSTSDEKV